MKREDFKILEEKVHKRDLVYLDNAATTQKPEVVIRAIEEAYSHWNANIHRGVHHLSQVATQKHEEARRKVAAYIGARSEREIIFTKGTTDSINIIARILGDWTPSSSPCLGGGKYLSEGDEIWVSEVEHHSNIVPWQMLCERNGCVLKVFKRGEVPTLSDSTKVVSVAWVSNVLGVENPVAEIVRRAHEVGAIAIVDGAQAVAHMEVNVSEIDADFLVFSGHKMYGPTGIGVLYGKEEWLEKLPPAEGGGEMIEHVRWEKTTYNTLPYKYEAGTPNYVGSYALGVAIDYIEAIGRRQIAEHEEELMAYAEEQLSQIEGVTIYAKGEKKHGALSFNVHTADGKLIHPFDIGTLLDQQGVAVRTGHHCAEPLIDSLGVPGTVRISVGLYNEKSDVDAFIQALNRALTMLL